MTMMATSVMERLESEMRAHVAKLENVDMKIAGGMSLDKPDMDVVRELRWCWTEFESELRAILKSSMDKFVAYVHSRELDTPAGQGVMWMLALLCPVDQARVIMSAHGSFLPTLQRAAADDFVSHLSLEFERCM